MKKSLLVSGMSPKRQRLLVKAELLKRKANASLYVFCNEVLGYDKMVPHVHEEMCRFLEHEIPRGESEQSTKILLEPRGVFKSTIGTVGYSLWRLVKNPNLTILLNNEKQKLVIDFLRAIKFHVTDNRLFKLLYGDWKPVGLGKRWNEQRIDIRPRSVWTPSPSIDTASTTSSTVGRHCDLIINDDLIGESNYGTPEQLAKVDEFVKNLGAVLNPGGEMNFTGTRWDHRDVYSTQMEHIKTLGEFARSDVLIKSAYKEDGSLFFPERLTEQFLKTQREKLRTFFFNCQYCNAPTNRADVLIQRVDKYGETIMIGDINVPMETFFADYCNTFVTVDLAYTDTKRSDNTAIFVMSVHKETGKRYVRDYRVFKTTKPQKVIDTLFEIDDRYKPIRYGIESNTYKAWLQVALKEAMRKKNHYLNIDPENGLPHYGKSNSKHLRLTKLAPVLNAGDCLLAGWMQDLEDQLYILTYDGTKGHDDLLDAFAMQEEIIFWGMSEPVNKYVNEGDVGESDYGLTRHESYGSIGLVEVENEWMYT